MAFAANYGNRLYRTTPLYCDNIIFSDGTSQTTAATDPSGAITTSTSSSIVPLPGSEIDILYSQTFAAGVYWTQGNVTLKTNTDAVNITGNDAVLLNAINTEILTQNILLYGTASISTAPVSVEADTLIVCSWSYFFKVTTPQVMQIGHFPTFISSPGTLTRTFYALDIIQII